ncbi:MAG: discoidin domain-containing protein [Nitrospinae bacterium]|nr:discoidin domain-containing protein [Nitrospinota bacterium]
MLANILPGKAAKTLADNGSSPAPSAASRAALIDGSDTTGHTFGGQAYTGNLCAGGAALSSGDIDAARDAAKAFDGDANTYWYSNYVYPGWVGYQFTAARTISKFRVVPLYAGAAGDQRLKDFSIDGSNDGVTWTTVFSGTAALQSATQDITFANTAAYTHWRLYIANGYDGTMYRPGISGLEMMEAAQGSLKILLDISAQTPVTEIRYVTDETDTTKVTIKGSSDGATFTTYSANSSGAGYLAASIGSAIRYVTIDHIPAASKTAYEVQVMAQRLEKQTAPLYRVFQPAKRTGMGRYAVGAAAPISKTAGANYAVRQPSQVKQNGGYHILQRTAKDADGAYHLTQPAIRPVLAAYCVRPPVPAVFDPAVETALNTLPLGLLYPGEVAAEFTLALWNDKGKLTNALTMAGVRITVSLAREGQFTGGGDPDGQEFVAARWLEVKSLGAAGIGITDDAQTAFTPVGGEPFSAGLLVGDIPPNCTRYLHCRVNVPAQVTTTHTARPRLLAVFHPAPVCGFGKKHGTEFGG